MAAKSKSLQVIFNGVLSCAFPRAVAYALFTSRNGHMLGYEKTVEEALEPNKVPEEMIKPESDKYWSPNPQTGVFGPSSASATNTTDENCGGQEDSVLEEKAWFRQTSLEDLDKTHHS